MSANQKKEFKPKVVAENRKARHNYDIIETFEAGLVLTGTEVKSLRDGKANIGESYASDEGNEIWIINSYIPEYSQGNIFNHEPRRRRKVLLHRKQVVKMQHARTRDGMTIVPLKVYFNEKGRAKVELAIAKGRKAPDKREADKKRDWDREKSRLMKAQ